MNGSNVSSPFRAPFTSNKIPTFTFELQKPPQPPRGEKVVLEKLKMRSYVKPNILYEGPDESIEQSESPKEVKPPSVRISSNLVQH